MAVLELLVLFLLPAGALRLIKRVPALRAVGAML